MKTFHVTVTIILTAEYPGDAQAAVEMFCEHGHNAINESFSTVECQETQSEEPVECVAFACSSCGFQGEEPPEDPQLWCPRCGHGGTYTRQEKSE